MYPDSSVCLSKQNCIYTPALYRAPREQFVLVDNTAWRPQKPASLLARAISSYSVFPLVSELNDGTRWFDIILFAYKEYTNSCFCKHSRNQTASTASLVIALSLFLTSSSTCLEKSPQALAVCQVARSSLHCPYTSTVSTATLQPLLSSLPASLHSFALGSVVHKCLRPFVVDTQRRNLVRR